MKKLLIKIISLILSLVFLALPITSFALDSVSFKELEALSVLPQGITENNIEKNVNRAEFSYMATHLVERENFVAVDTRFSDVDKTNIYSGHIEFMAQLGIINGVTETEFNPEGNITSIMAYKIIINLLGYEVLANKLGGYPNGYIEVANQFGLTSIVSPSDEVLTVKEASELIYEVLTNEYPQISYAETNGKVNTFLGEEKFSVLQRLKISSYTGKFTSVSDDNKSVTFEVTKNNYDTNYEILSKGEIVRLNLKNGIDAYHYMNVPISIYVDSNEKIICITENKKYEILYTYITAVNGNEDKDASYAKATIENISITDFEDEFDVTEDFSMDVAGVTTTSQTKITGSFAKVVLLEGEVQYIDVWPITKGGIMQNINAQSIEYINGDNGIRKIKDLSAYKNVYVYINGTRNDLDQLKKNSVFDYYANGNTLMIACCEKTITDTVHAFSDTSIEIGNVNYRYEELFYQVKDKYEKKSTSGGINTLLGEEVTAYFGPDGMIRYITSIEEVETGEFYAIVLGINDEDISEEREIKLLSVYPVQETVVLKLTKKTRYNADITVDLLKKGAYKGGTYQGDGVYSFTKNSKNEIVAVNYPEYIKGFESPNANDSVNGMVKKTGITSIISYIKLKNNKPYFISGSPIVAVYNVGGELVAKQTEYSKLSEKKPKSATMVFFGGDVVKPSEFVLLCGDLEKTGDIAVTRGIITSKQMCLDENGDNAWEIKALVKGGGEEVYTVTEKIAKDIPENALVAYYKNQLYYESSVCFENGKTVDLTKNSKDWVALTDGISSGLQKAKIVEISDTRIYAENESGEFAAHCMHPSRCIMVEVDESHPVTRFRYIEHTDVEPGDTVFYEIAAEGVEAIIVVR